MCGQTINVLLEIKEMDKKYLNKVLDQIVSETIIDHDEEMLYTPFSYHIGFFSSFLYLSPLFLLTTSPTIVKKFMG